MKSNSGLDFIDRILRTTGFVLLIFFPFGLYYLGFYPSLAILSGGVWGMLNFMFIAFLVRATLRPGGPDLRSTLIGALIKFPLLYAAGYFLLRIPQFEPLHLLLGFSGLLAIVILKVLGRALVGLDKNELHNRSSKGMSTV